MVTMSVIERSTSSYAVQGARAYHAALSGVEWGIGRAVADNACPAATTFTVAVAGTSSFAVNVQCISTTHREPQTDPGPFRVFVITATASTGTFGTLEFFSRSAQATVTDADPS